MANFDKLLAKFLKMGLSKTAAQAAAAAALKNGRKTK